MTLGDLIAMFRGRQAQATPTGPAFDPSQPWLYPQGGAPAVAPSPPPAAAAPYAFATPDPMAQAQQLVERQQAVSQLASPMTPLLEVPLDVVLDVARKMKAGK